MRFFWFESNKFDFGTQHHTTGKKWTFSEDTANNQPTGQAIATKRSFPPVQVASYD